MTSQAVNVIDLDARLYYPRMSSDQRKGGPHGCSQFDLGFAYSKNVQWEVAIHTWKGT